jgi:hypothetical protein
MPIHALPPNQPNVFSDGSVGQPTTSFAHGAFGVVYPERLDDDRTDAERDVAVRVDLGPINSKAGIAVAGVMTGLVTSSTRAELAGAIVSLLRREPIHLAADDEAVIIRGTKLLTAHGPGKKPWSLQRDGDLWQQVYQLIQERGPSTAVFTWTKGHATLRHIQEQHSAPRNAVFNSLADRAASRGQHLDIVCKRHELFKYVAHKQECLIRATTAIARRIARVATAATTKLEDLKKSATFERARNYVDTPPVPTYSDVVSGIHLVYEALSPFPHNGTQHIAKRR